MRGILSERISRQLRYIESFTIILLIENKLKQKLNISLDYYFKKIYGCYNDNYSSD